MSGYAYRAILWKETRMLAGLWIAALLLAALIGASVVTSAWREANLWLQFVNLMAAVPAFYATGCAATLFAGEKETRNHLFLGTLPLSTRELFGGKLMFAAISSLALALVIAVGTMVAMSSLNGSVPAKTLTAQQITVIWTVWLTFTAVGLASGLLASLLMTRPIAAVCLGIAIASSIVHLFTWTATPDLLEGNLDRLMLVGPVLVAAIVLLMMDRRLAANWLYTESMLTARAKGRSTIAAYTRERLWPEVIAFGRLYWLAWRHSRMTIGAVFVLIVAASSWMLTYYGADLGRITTIVILQFGIGSAFIGSTAFQGQFRFLTEIGVSPKLLWWSRHIFWIPLLAVAVVSLGISSSGELVRVDRGWFDDEWTTNPWYVTHWWIGLVAVGYGVGQLASVTIRRPLVATMVGIILAWLLSNWARLMWSVALSFIPTSLPIVAGLLLLSWMAVHWLLLARLTLRRQYLVFAILGGIVAAQVGAVRAYRIYSIADVALPGAITDEPTVETEQLAAAELYRQAMYGLTEVPFDPDADSTGRRAVAMTDERRDWLKRHHKELEQALRASRGPIGDFQTSQLHSASTLRALLNLTAQSHESESRLDKALECYWASLHFSASQANKRPFAYLHQPFYREFRYLMDWAALPDQSRELLHRAISRIEQLKPLTATAREQVTLDYRFMFAELEMKDQGGSADGYIEPWPAQLVMIGEPARAHRALTVLANRELQRAIDYDAQLAQGNGIHSSIQIDWRKAPNEVRSTPSIHQIYRTQAFEWIAASELWRRATIIVLALHAWRIENGRFPNDLKELVGTEIQALPVDPYSGQMFQYVRDGFPSAINAISIDGRAGFPRSSIPPNTPFIWATSPFVRVGTIVEHEYDTATQVNRDGRWEYVWRGSNVFDAISLGSAFPLFPPDEQ